MIGIRLTKDSSGRHDMLFENGAFVMAEDGEAVASALDLAMHTERIECEESQVVDSVQYPLAGVDYYGIVFKTSVSKAEKILEIKRAMMAVPGVERILRFSWTQSGRTVSISADIKTEWGEESVSQEIEPL